MASRNDGIVFTDRVHSFNVLPSGEPHGVLIGHGTRFYRLRPVARKLPRQFLPVLPPFFFLSSISISILLPLFLHHSAIDSLSVILLSISVLLNISQCFLLASLAQ